MKKYIIIIFIVFNSLISYSQRITIGPNIGEIYFIGPTYTTGDGLYYSTDFGFSAVCMDSISNIRSICADITDGYIYYRDLMSNIYLSFDYGEYGTWNYKNTDVSTPILGGRIPGEIFSSFTYHSNDYAETFIPHECNGYFGYKVDVTLDQENENIGYVLSSVDDPSDSLYLFITYNKFENVEVKKVFNYINGNPISLSQGSNSGEIFLYNHSLDELLFSNNYGEHWIMVNKLNELPEFTFAISGGRSNGKLYLLYKYLNMSGINAYVYILHSIDNGITFEVFTPFSKGEPPLLANFSAKTTGSEIVNFSNYDSVYFVIGDAPLEVQFSNYTIGKPDIYEWDFENDGVIDSYEEEPIHIYQDTGWYSVKLTAFYEDDSNTFIKENLIYVDKVAGIELNETIPLSCFPNPFTSYLNINIPFLTPNAENMINIYSLSGMLINVIITQNSNVIWDGKDKNGNDCSAGIYIIKSDNYSQKVILSK